MSLTKKDMIAALKLKGIDKLYPKALSRASKKEIEEVYHLIITHEAPFHLSYSSVNMFMRCPMQHFYRYKKGIVLPPGVALTLGGAFDDAASYNYEQKIKTKQDEPLDAVQDAFRTGIQERQDDTLWGDEKQEDVENLGLSLIETWHENIAPLTVPEKVQHKYVIQFDNTLYKFIGYADVIGHERDAEKVFEYEMIFENKTSARDYNQNFVDAHPQLTAYAACHVAETHYNPTMAVDVTIKTKEVKAKRYKTERTKSDIVRWWRTVEKVYQAICAGAWFPVSAVHGSQSNWVCSEKFCGYWHICHEEI